MEMEIMQNIGVVNGRFQPFHNDHLRYVLAAAEKSDYLIVGITNPDPSLTRYNKIDAHRSLISANPLSYYERMVIIKECLIEAKIPTSKFDIVPFPINRPEIIPAYIPSNATHYITIYDNWGRDKCKMLKSLGFQVNVLWEKEPADKKISASEIRKLIANGLQWEHLVPNAVATIIKKLHLDNKIKSAQEINNDFL